MVVHAVAVNWEERYLSQIEAGIEDLRDRYGELDAKLDRFRTEIKEDIGNLRTELKQDIAELRGDFKSLQRSLLFGFVAVIAVSLLVHFLR